MVKVKNRNILCFKYKTTKVLDYFPGCLTLEVSETFSVVDFH